MSSSSGAGMTTAQPHPSIPVHATVPASAIPPAKIAPNCHLDPSSYVKGHHQLTIEANALVHPRTYLFTELGPITIRQGTVIMEKCVLGRREKTDTSHQRGQPSIAVGRPLSIVEGLATTDTLHDPTAQPQGGLPEITIGPNAHLHASVTVQAPSTISDSATLESGVMISPGCIVGAHSKICAGITLPPNTVIPEWTIVYGMNGCMRRRKLDDGAEETRLDLFRRERAATEALLRSAARNLGGGQAGGAGAQLKSKRESMIRG